MAKLVRYTFCICGFLRFFVEICARFADIFARVFLPSSADLGRKTQFSNIEFLARRTWSELAARPVCTPPALNLAHKPGPQSDETCPAPQAVWNANRSIVTPKIKITHLFWNPLGKYLRIFIYPCIHHDIYKLPPHELARKQIQSALCQRMPS